MFGYDLNEVSFWRIAPPPDIADKQHSTGAALNSPGLLTFSRGATSERAPDRCHRIHWEREDVSNIPQTRKQNEILLP